MRTELQNSAVITLTADGMSRTFRIERTIGQGASCVAYEATLIDGNNARLRYRVKECYPYNAAITRSGNTLVWHSDDERNHAFQKLKTTHELLLRLRNDEDIGDSIVTSSLYEGNGTIYLVMELNHGVTYDMDDTATLHDTLDAIRVLAARIGQLHKMGYLHLDIKPSNFLVRHYPSTSVWLFDVDSFTSLDDIISGKVVSYMYSRQFAAPEQICGKTKRFCPATDIYAIGAVLFSKIMGRPVCNEDMGLFATWSFDGKLFDSVNPKVKRILRELFQRTLAASPSRRYQTVDELLKVIEDGLRVTADGKPYLRSSAIGNTIRFVGRMDEIERIHKAFDEKKRAVFLHGEGGMGKSCTAIAYSEAYRDDYDAVIFLRYRDSLRQTLKQIHIAHFESDNESEREQALTSLMDDHVLLMIDNFNVEIDQDEYLPELLKGCHAHILLTSRTDFSSAYDGIVEQIEIDRLTDAQVLNVFAHASRLGYEVLETSTGFKKLCKLVEYNTLLLDLMGKQCFASGITVDELWEKLKSGLHQTEHMERVWIQKDGRSKSQTIHMALHVLFDMTGLSEQRQRALRNLYVLRFLDIDRNTYCRFTGSEKIDVLNELVDLGWVQRRERFFLLHSLIEELIEFDLTPTWDNCDAFSSIGLLVKEISDPSSFDADAIKSEFIDSFMISFSLHHKLSNESVRKLVLDWLCRNMNHRFALLPGLSTPQGRNLYDLLNELINTNDLTEEEAATIRSVHFAALLDVRHAYCFYSSVLNKIDIYDYGPYGPELHRYRYNVSEHELRLAYEQLLVLLKNTSKQIIDKVVGSLAKYLSRIYQSDMTEINFRELYVLSPNSFDRNRYLRYTLNLPINDKERHEWDNSRVADENKFITRKKDPYLTLILQHIDDYKNAYNKKAVIEQIVNQETYSHPVRGELINACITSFLQKLHYSVGASGFDNVNWAEQLEILTTENSFLLSIELSKLSEQDRESWRYYFDCNIINKIVVLAMLNLVDDFENEVNYHFGLFDCTAYNVLKNAKEHFLCQSYLSLNIRSPVRGLCNLNRACYAVPIVMRFVEIALAEAHKQKIPDDFERDHCLGLYETLIRCLEAASTEENIPEKLRLPYGELIEKYKLRIAQLTDTGYQIKAPKEDE